MNQAPTLLDSLPGPLLDSVRNPGDGMPVTEAIGPVAVRRVIARVGSGFVKDSLHVQPYPQKVVKPC